MSYFLHPLIDSGPHCEKDMDITRLGKDGNSYRTSMPRHIMKALGLTGPDYIIWTWNSKGFAEVRKLPEAHQLARITDKK